MAIITQNYYSHRDSSLSPTAGGNQKSMLSRGVAYTCFAALRRERHLLAFTVADTESRELFCWLLILVYAHATQNKPHMCYAIIFSIPIAQPR